MRRRAVVLCNFGGGCRLLVRLCCAGTSAPRAPPTLPRALAPPGSSVTQARRRAPPAPRAATALVLQRLAPSAQQVCPLVTVSAAGCPWSLFPFPPSREGHFRTVNGNCNCGGVVLSVPGTFGTGGSTTAACSGQCVAGKYGTVGETASTCTGSWVLRVSPAPSTVGSTASSHPQTPCHPVPPPEPCLSMMQRLHLCLASHDLPTHAHSRSRSTSRPPPPALTRHT